MNFPSSHPLHTPALGDPITQGVADADVILASGSPGLWTLTHKMTASIPTAWKSLPRLNQGRSCFRFRPSSCNHKSNYQDFGRYVEVDLNITGDAEATLPELIEAVKRLITADRKRFFEQRGAKIADANRKLHDRNREMAAVRVGRQPHQHGAPGRRSLGAD